MRLDGFGYVDKNLKKEVESFGLVSLFNSISNFVGYLMPKPSFKRNTSNTIKPIVGGFIPFPGVFVRK